LAAKLKDEFGIDATLIAGAGGIFDVCLGDELVYSKHQTGRFPDEDAVVESIRRETADGET